MSTVHIEANKEDIAKRILMPGDPNRTSYIANKYLKDARLVNRLRGELAYTGTYKGTEVTIFSSGMGIGSMGIYSHELFEDYDAEVIIRIGTAGAYDKDIKPYTLFLASSAYSTTDFDTDTGVSNLEIINSSFEINDVITSMAHIERKELLVGRVHTTDAFYSDSVNYDELLNKNCKVVDMETYALLYNAKKYHKKATSLFTISNNLVTKEEMSSLEREQNLNEMITLALDSIIKINI